MNDAADKPVLVPSPAGEGRELIARLRELGHEVDHAPFLDLRMNRDSDTKHAVAALMEGRFTQLVLDCPRAVDVLLSYADNHDDENAEGDLTAEHGSPGHTGRPRLALPHGMEVTAVGADTAAALQEVGIEPALTIPPFDTAPAAHRAPAPGTDTPRAAAGVPAAQETGAGLLLITSAATPVSITRALQESGYAVTRVNGYRPVPVSLDSQVVRDLRLAGYAAVALPSTLLADLAGHLGIHRDIQVVAMHDAATAAAEARSLVVHGQATEPTGAALAEAIHRAVAGS